MNSAPLRLFVLLLPLLLWVTPAAAQEWEWAEGKTIQGVDWKGLKRINPAEANGLIATRKGKRFDSRALAQDVARLYRSGRFGSPTLGVAPVTVLVRAVPAGVIVEFTVHERRIIRRTLFVGVKEILDQKDVDAQLSTKAGGRFDVFAVQRDARAIRKMMRDKGHVMATVTWGEEAHPSGVDIVFTARAGPAVYVNEIVFKGAKQLDPGILADASGPDAFETKERQLFGLLEDGLYKPDAFDRDLDRISRYYRSQGFLDARAFKLRENYSLNGRALTLEVQVEEGRRYTVRRVGVDGTKVIDGDRILRALPLKPGRPFLGDDLRKSIEAIRHLYGQRAYVHAAVDVDVRYDLKRALLDVTLRVREGPKVRIEQIKIEGNTKTQEKVIRRELSFYPGEYFNADEVQASISRLGRLRFFSDVRIDFAKGSKPGSEHVIVRVVEARTGSFVLGGGVSTATGFFGNISLTQRNFDILDLPKGFRDFLDGRSLTGAGQNLTISLQPGRERSQFSIEFTEPWLLGFPVPLTLQGLIRDRQREDWLESRRAGRFGLGYRITQDLVFRTTYRIERVHVADLEVDSPPDAIEVAGTSYVSGLRASLNYNQNRIDRDLVVFGGYAATVYYEVVGQFLGGDYDFHRAGIEANWQTHFFAWPNHHKWVLQLRGEIGWQRSFSPGKEKIPIFERFFAGGPGSLRGFRFRTVGPKHQGDDPIGGNFTVTATAEFSFPLFRDLLRGVVFVDTGTVTTSHRDYTTDDLRIAAGFGFRIKVPFFPAPVQLDFAWPLKDQDDDERQVFSFAVGFGF